MSHVLRACTQSGTPKSSCSSSCWTEGIGSCCAVEGSGCARACCVRVLRGVILRQGAGLSARPFSVGLGGGGKRVPPCCVRKAIFLLFLSLLFTTLSSKPTAHCFRQCWNRSGLGPRQETGSQKILISFSSTNNMALLGMKSNAMRLGAASRAAGCPAAPAVRQGAMPRPRSMPVMRSSVAPEGTTGKRVHTREISCSVSLFCSPFSLTVASIHLLQHLCY